MDQVLIKADELHAVKLADDLPGRTLVTRGRGPLQQADASWLVEMVQEIGQEHETKTASPIDLEGVPNEDRVSPPFPALFSFVMLGSTPNGDAYTTPEFEEMGRRAGFSKVTVAQLPPTPQALITMEAS